MASGRVGFGTGWAASTDVAFNKGGPLLRAIIALWPRSRTDVLRSEAIGFIGPFQVTHWLSPSCLVASAAAGTLFIATHRDREVNCMRILKKATSAPAFAGAFSLPERVRHKTSEGLGLLLPGD
jgi:hypothetical protein